MPTLTQLEYIVAVDTHRHFGLAAKKCYVTQPTLSMQIKKAEEELGVVIFDRSKQPVIPTDVGKALIDQARNILRELQQLDAIITDFQNDVSGNLRLGIIPTLAPYLLPLFVGNFIRKYPKIHLQVFEKPTEEIVKALQNDLLDVGLLVTPLQEHAIREIPLFYEEIKVYTHAKHEFKPPHTDRLPIAALEGTELWMLSEGHCFRNQVVNLCSINKTENPDAIETLPFEYESGSLEALQRLVDYEGGFTLLPELAIPPHPKGRIRSIEAPAPLREVSLVYVRNFAKMKLLELLQEEILAAIPADMKKASRGQVVEWK